MRSIISFILFCMISQATFPVRLGVIGEVKKPSSISIYEDELYIIDGAEIMIYSIIDLKFIKKFGRLGQGPGELPVEPNYSNKLIVFKDYIIAECRTKLVYYKKDGTLIKEIKKTSQMVLHSIPIDKNFVVSNLKFGRNSKNMYNCISLYGPDMKEIKELYRMNFMQQGQPPKAKLDMLFDSPNVKVYDNKIFIEESSEGFVIDVFDKDGNNLYRINKKYKKKKISQEYKDDLINRIKQDRIVKIFGGWGNFKKMYSFVFPNIFPAIKSIDVSEDKIYVLTYDRKDNKNLCIILNLKGEVITKSYFPIFWNESIVDSLLGTKLNVIYKNTLYFLTEDEEDESWILNKESIK